MDEIPKTDLTSSTGDGWHSAYIASPRRLQGRTYAMILKCDGGEETIARDVTIAQALVIALEHRSGYGAAMFYRDRAALREYVIGRRRLGGNAFEPVLRGVVPRTTRLATDHVRALEFFEEILEHDPRVFFDGRLESAFVRASRRANVIGGAT
jgi:hypothetical protein